LNTVAFLTLGFASIAGVGGGLIYIADRENVDAWLTVTATVLFTSVFFAAWRFLFKWRPFRWTNAQDRYKRLKTSMESATIWARNLGLALLAQFVLLVGLLRWLPAISDWISLGSLIIVALLLVSLLPPKLAWPAGVLIVALAIAVKFDLIDVDLQILTRAYEEIIIRASLVAPMALAAWFVLRASSERATRRAVGVAWDLLNYWPRTFHPWAPSPYTEVAIPALEKRIGELAATAGVERVVVSAHSQGAVIAVPVLRRLESLEKISFLSYGCLLGAHYRWLFPRLFEPPLVSGLNRRWCNLYRTTDPLGYPIEEPACGNVIADSVVPGVGRVLSHGDYQYSLQYQDALSELAEAP
jgi:hypothetical protein